MVGQRKGWTAGGPLMPAPPSFELVAGVPRRIVPVVAVKGWKSVHPRGAFQQSLWNGKTDILL